MASDFSVRIAGLPEFNAALTRIERQIDVATAAALNCLVTSRELTSGKGFDPNDSLITLT